MAVSNRCSYFGNVTLGSDVSLEELRELYDVVRFSPTLVILFLYSGRISSELSDSSVLNRAIADYLSPFFHTILDCSTQSSCKHVFWGYIRPSKHKFLLKITEVGHMYHIKLDWTP